MAQFRVQRVHEKDEITYRRDIMPRLVKGGKYVYGWSKVKKNGEIVIPDEALQEYELQGHTKVILLPGSKKSGGFGVTTVDKLKNSALSHALDTFQMESRTKGEIVHINGNPWCWVELRGNRMVIPAEVLKVYQVIPGEKVLAVKGSGLALGFAAKGPIVKEARTHDLKIFE
jgi:bifunctional DNA-binding transcriptional regulator/antitoxin component of YhaV-PrlF toxin-antitoxin module